MAELFNCSRSHETLSQSYWDTYGMLDEDGIKDGEPNNWLDDINDAVMKANRNAESSHVLCLNRLYICILSIILHANWITVYDDPNRASLKPKSELRISLTLLQHDFLPYLYIMLHLDSSCWLTHSFSFSNASCSQACQYITASWNCCINLMWHSCSIHVGANLQCS